MRRMLLAVIVAALAASFGCQPETNEAGAATRGESPSSSSSSSSSTGGMEPVPVETMHVGPSTFRQTTTVPGVAEAVETVNVSVEQPGRIERMRIEEGETVRKGASLFQLSTESERARISRLENAVEAAKREYERTERLREDGIATPQELDRARTEWRDAKLQLEQAEIALDLSRVRSPIDGVVTTIRIEEGEYAAPGRPVAVVADLSSIEIAAAVPASRIGAVAKGDDVEVAIPPIDETVTGTITRLPSTVSSETRTYPVEIRVDNPEQRIRPGMRASLTLTRKVWKEAVVIPRTAVLQGYTREEIAVVPKEDDASGRATIRGVELGPSKDNRVVVEKGLELGEQLVVRGHRSLMEEAPVRVVETYDGLNTALEAGL